jgi:hypothetical protein
MMTLAEQIEQLDGLPGRHAIYAATPWRPSSAVVVGPDTAHDAVPAGMTYLTTVSEAREVVADRRRCRPDLAAVPDKLCAAVVYYARYDAIEPLPSTRSGAFLVA